MLLVDGSSETELFRHLSNHLFGDRNIRSTKFMRVNFFLEMFKISKMLKKIEKRFFASEIIASELVSLIVPIKTRILANSSQCVKKQSQDLTYQ